MLAPAEDVEEVRIEEEEGEGAAAVPRPAPEPGDPTARQIEEHRRTHMPYRSWCKWCVLGRSRGSPHKSQTKSEIPVIGVDYFFLTKSGVKAKEEVEEAQSLEEARTKGEAVKCLVVRCSWTKCVFAHIVPQKGLDEENIAVDMLLSDLEWLGHTRMILKSDGEPSVQALVRRTIGLAKSECRDLKQISKEESAAYDSQSNGLTEIGVRLIRGVFRTLKVCLEDRVDKSIPIDHALVAWLLEHTCLVLNVMGRGEDGITPWHRARGRPFKQQLVGFGERVLYRFPAKGPQHAPGGNMGPLGDEGVFLGYHRSSNTFMVGTKDGGLVRARGVARRNEAERWSAQALADVCRLPHERRDRESAQRLPFDGPAEHHGPTAEATRPAPLRRLRINKKDLEKFGFHPECPQCEHIQRYGNARPGHAHTDACRKQLEDAMAATEEGKARLAAHEESLTRAMAEQVERADRPQGEPPRSEPRRSFEDRADVPASSTPHVMPSQARAASGHRAAPARVGEPHPTDAAVPTADDDLQDLFRPDPSPQPADEPARAPSIPDEFDRGDGVMEHGDPDEGDV